MSEGMSTITKLQPVIIIIAAVAGILLGQFDSVSGVSGDLIEPFLMVLLFIIFLKIDIRDIGRSFRNTRFTAASLAINFIWTPIFAVLLGILFLGDSMDLRIGLLMLLVTPCTDWYLVFTGMSKGNVALSTSILPLNLVIQMVLLPVYLFLFLGTGSSIDMGSMLWSIVYVLVIPFVLANIIKILVGRTHLRERVDNVLDDQGDNLQLVFLCLAVVVMFASQGRMITENPILLVRMLIPLGVFFLANFIIAQYAGRRMGFDHADNTSFTFTTLARNSPLALAIAVAAFPENPLIALVLVVGPLIELPVLALASNVLLRMRANQESADRDQHFG